MLKSKKGITLVALVITIIVLIILAGVSINLIIREDGLIQKAMQAKEDYKNESEKEKTVLDHVTKNIDESLFVDKTVEGPKNGASYDDPYIPTGFIHYAGQGTWNDGYTIVEKSTNNEFVWVPCVLSQDKVKNGDEVVTFKKTLPETSEITDINHMYNPENLSLLPKDTTVNSEDSSVTKIRESVGKYGGFYIAKYEAGIQGTEQNYRLGTYTSTNGSTKPLSQKEKGLWNWITITDAINVSKAMINNSTTGVNSALISGECWDTTLQWMVKTSKNKNVNKEYDINPEGKGWMAKPVESDEYHTTGYYGVNNIYDMAGNAWEWTTENCKKNGTQLYTIRGGCFGTQSIEYPTSYRLGYEWNIGISVGFRVVMYK